MRQISTTLQWQLLTMLAIVGVMLTPLCSAQVAFRDLDVSVLKNPAPGYYFIAPNSMDSISMLDHAGKNMFKRRVGPHANVLPYKGKWLTHFATIGNTPVFIRRDVNLNPIDTLRTVNGVQTDFHECRIISDTSYIILGIREDTVDLSSIPGGRPRAIVWNNVIQERTFSGRTLVEWRSLDHIPVADAIDSVEVNTPVVDYIHINSVVIDRDGNYLISCRHTDEVIKVNRSTGAVMWRLGGSLSKGNQFQWLNDSTGGFRGFSHQHSAIRTARGTILLFDNGPVVGILQSVGILNDSQGILGSPFAVVAALTYNFLPFMVLPIYVSLEKLDHRLLDAAADLYSSPARAFRKITLRLSLPGLFAGTLLTFIPAAGDFVNSELLGSDRTVMIGQIIEKNFGKEFFRPELSALSFMLMAMILVGVIVYARLLGTEEIA